MADAVMTTKGRITVPAAVREVLCLRAGDQVKFVEVALGRFEIMAINKPIAALKGMFGPAKRSVSIAQMNAAIAQCGRSAN